VAERPLLVMASVARRFGRVRAVEDASLALLRGTTVGVLGESGSGKSTLARLAAGLLRPDAGDILYDGTDMHARTGLFARPPPHRRIAMVFQDAAASFDPRWSIGRGISEPIVAYRLRTGKVGVKDRAIQTMAMVGLPEQLVDLRPDELTPSQIQRAAVARALAAEPELLICDEPTRALDLSMQALVLNALREAQARSRIGMLIASPDPGTIRQMSDLVAVMLRGRVVEFGLADDVFSRPRHPYAQALLDALPALSAPRPAARTGPTDPVPPPAASGLCAFAPRCPVALARCRTDPPPLADADGVAVACHAVAAAG